MMLLQPKFNQNDPKWPKITQNDPKWPKMVQNGPKWPKMAQNDPKWHCSPRSWNLTCSKTEVNLSSAWVTRLECPKGVKDEVKQARRAKRVAEGHQLEIGAQRAPRFLVSHNCKIVEIFYQNPISHSCKIGEIFYQNPISHSCRFDEIFDQTPI